MAESRVVIAAVKLAHPGYCPRWCDDKRPGVHAHDVLDALRNAGFEIRQPAQCAAEGREQRRAAILRRADTFDADLRRVDL